MNNELTAALLTIEKCRELSGCPAGVGLQDWVKQLTAENVGLTQFITQRCYVFDGEQHDVSDAYICATDGGMPETPATDRILAEAEARGIEMGIAHLENKFNSIGVQIMNLQWLADSLREGSDK
ncbi:hypothetical protein ACH677_11190 [Klebsiella aerogenes]|uniref:hypothetical protein n=1 Tax=Klebsiella aerogenes TaxID=548 RepID=UPI00378B4D12